MRMPVERPDGVRFVHRPRLRGEIELRDVTFTYPGQKLPALAGVQAVAPHNGAVQLLLDQQTSPQDILQQLVSQHSAIEQFEIALPSLDEIFIRVVSEQ
jgi:ABC-type uncharacterized transport system ATPase subunit